MLQARLSTIVCIFPEICFQKFACHHTMFWWSLDLLLLRSTFSIWSPCPLKQNGKHRFIFISLYCLTQISKQKKNYWSIFWLAVAFINSHECVQWRSIRILQCGYTSTWCSPHVAPAYSIAIWRCLPLPFPLKVLITLSMASSTFFFQPLATVSRLGRRWSGLEGSTTS